MEAEDRISEVEDRMVEINESERIKEKRIKRNEDNLRVEYLLETQALNFAMMAARDNQS